MGWLVHAALAAGGSRLVCGDHQSPAVCGGQFPCGSTLASVAVDGSTDHTDAADPHWSEAWLGSPLVAVVWIAMAPLGLWLLAGGLGLLPVGTRSWGGLTLTLLLTGGSGALALPLGILLALGRRSELPVLRWSSAAYIELMRAVPLIAVLFFGQLLIPLFLPPGLEINRVLRAVVAFALFAAAYIAEDVRGGLQAIPPTQREAAAVLGLSPRQVLQLVVLPQALRVALPSLTNQAVGLLQNTSLMAILGLVELLGISRSLLANPAFIGRYLEVYLWLAAVYWLACTAMALLARHLEVQLDPARSAS